MNTINPVVAILLSSVEPRLIARVGDKSSKIAHKILIRLLLTMKKWLSPTSVSLNRPRIGEALIRMGASHL